MTDLHPGARRASLDTIDRDGLVAFVQELVRVPSVNRPAEGLSEAPAAALVAERMRAFGWQPVVEEVAPGRPNVVCDVVGGLPGPTLLFEGHTDVVTEGDPSGWTHPPFDAVIEGGRLHGRGSADMKGGLGAMLFATAALASAGPFPGRIRLAALCDEEEMMIGVKHFVAAGWAADVDAAIVCEPEDGEVCTTQKGAIRLRVDAAGRMAHGAMPQHGRNPLTALARLQGRLESLQAELQARTGEHPHLGWPYVTPTVVSGGTLAQLNVIPADAFLGVDLRTVPGVDHPQLIERVRAEAAAVAAETEVGLAVTVIDDRPPTDTDETHPVVQAVFDAHAAVTGETPRYGGVPGSTDGTILWRDGGLPVVVYGPGGKWIAHQVDEYVEVAQLIEAAGVYLLAADTFLRGGAAGR